MKNAFYLEEIRKNTFIMQEILQKRYGSSLGEKTALFPLKRLTFENSKKI